MIIGIGCDIVKHDTAVRLNWESDFSVQKRIFTFKELEIFNQEKDIKFLAGRFAAKEALLKCLGTGMQDGIALTEIQILQLENGKPIIEIHGEAKIISDAMEINLWHISISHSTEYSMAIVIAEKF